jgi:hypothetical protein
MSDAMKVLLRRSGTSSENVPLLNLITGEIQTNKYKRVSACAAYASYKGVTTLRAVFGQTVRFRWLFGLDDGITDPQALRVAMGMHDAESRFVQAIAGKRFHAKTYLLDQSDHDTALLIIGSTNLTYAALQKNCEVYAVFEAKGSNQTSELQKYWRAFWDLGVDASETLVREYEKRRKQWTYRDPTVEEEESTDVQTRKEKTRVKLTLSSSRLAWIVLGRNTGGGGQLDIVKRLAPFLDLPSNPREGTTVNLRIEAPSGPSMFQITFTKGMWRFMNLQHGFRRTLRPDLRKPSPYLLVLTRGENGELHMKLERLGSAQADAIIEISRKSGFVDSSKPDGNGRLFGWY